MSIFLTIISVLFLLTLAYNLFIFYREIKKMNGSDEQNFKAAKARRNLIWTIVSMVIYITILLLFDK